jgi:hypothetical protein
MSTRASAQGVDGTILRIGKLHHRSMPSWLASTSLKLMHPTGSEMAFRPGFSVRLRSAEHHARQAAMAAMNICGLVRPAKAGMFSGSQSHRRKSQDLRSLGRIRGGNESDEADRRSHPWDGERVTGPQRE